MDTHLNEYDMDDDMDDSRESRKLHKAAVKERINNASRFSKSNRKNNDWKKPVRGGVRD